MRIKDLSDPEKVFQQIRDACPGVVEDLIAIARGQTEAKDSDRIAAGKLLLAYAYGHPVERMEHGADMTLEQLLMEMPVPIAVKIGAIRDIPAVPLEKEVKPEEGRLLKFDGSSRGEAALLDHRIDDPSGVSYQA